MIHWPPPASVTVPARSFISRVRPIDQTAAWTIPQPIRRGRRRGSCVGGADEEVVSGLGCTDSSRVEPSRRGTVWR